MFAWLIFVFITVPVVEIVLLIRLGQAIDVGPTIAVIVVTGVVGAALARHEGLKAWTRVQNDLAAGAMPAAEITNALLILVAGVLLVTPGILTDLFGFSLLIPPIRNFYKRKLAAFFRSRIVTVHHCGNGDFIDVEPTDVGESPSKGPLP